MRLPQIQRKNGREHSKDNFGLFSVAFLDKLRKNEVISKVIQKMAFDAIRKELQRVVCTCCL